MDASTLSGLTRVQLQKIAKLHGIKANRKTELIIEDLLAKYPSGVPRASRKPKRAAPLSAPIHPPSPSKSHTAHLADPDSLPIEVPHASTSSVMIPPSPSAAPPPPTIPRTPVQSVRPSSPPRTSPQTRTDRKEARRSVVAQGSPIRAPKYASASAASTPHLRPNAGQRSVGFVSPPSPESPRVMRGSSRAHTPVPLNFEQSLGGEGAVENSRVLGENAGPAPSTPRMAESPFLGSAPRRKRDLYRSPTPAPATFRQSLDNRAANMVEDRDGDKGSQSSRGYAPNSPPYRPASSGHQSSRGYTPNSPPYCPVSPDLPPRVYSPSSVDSFLRSLNLPPPPLSPRPSAPLPLLASASLPPLSSTVLAPPQPLSPVGGTKTSAGSASKRFVNVATLQHLTSMMQEMADSNQAAVDHLPRVMQEAARLTVEVERCREQLLIARRQRLDLQEWLTKFINGCGEGEVDQEVIGDGRREAHKENADTAHDIPHPSDQVSSAKQRGAEERFTGEVPVYAAQSGWNGTGRPTSNDFGRRAALAPRDLKSPNGSEKEAREVSGGARAAHSLPDREIAIFGNDESDQDDDAAPSRRAPAVDEQGEVPDREDWDPSRRALFFGEYDDEPDQYEDRHSSLDPEEIPEVSTLPTQAPALALPPHSVCAPSHSPMNITFGYYPGSTDNFPLSPPLRRVSSSEGEYTPPNFPSVHFSSSPSRSLRDVPQSSPAGVKRKRSAAPSPPSDAAATIAEDDEYEDEDGFSEHRTSSPVVGFSFNGKRRKLDSSRSGAAGSHRGTASPEVQVKVEHSDDELDRSNVAEMLSFDHDHRIDGHSSDSSRSDADHDARRQDWPLPPEAMFFSRLPR